MATPSNLYAEKVFAEHPTALWSLDEQSDYISIIQEASRSLAAGWAVIGGSASSISPITGQPFPDSAITKISATPTVGETTGTVTCVSAPIANFNQLNSAIGTMTIGLYAYSYISLIRSISIGYVYDTNVYNLKTFSFTSQTTWEMFSDTFEFPQISSPFSLVVAITYAVDPETSTYEFLVNGLTVGQIADEFNAKSLGISASAIDSSIALSSAFGIRAESYGLQEQNGYYLTNKTSICARNFGFPMVYGSQSVTTLYPNADNLPSLIVPGFGFLNKEGQFRDTTFEFWLKVNAGSTIPFRIVGPIGSTDGLYVKESSIALKIDDNIQSHFIGEWGRPMLVQIRLTENQASLVINGDQVISMLVQTNLLDLPSKFNESTGKDQDWIGFYTNDTISPIQVDCVAIYPYYVPEIVSKRRFVYGQGVAFPENVSSSSSTNSVFADYPLAQYSNNYSYPDIGRWQNGFYNNLNIESNSISLPQYVLPKAVFSNKTEAEWQADLATSQPSSDYHITLAPTSSWMSTSGYLIFQNMNILNSTIKSFYGIFDKTNTTTTKETLIRVVNEGTGNYFEIALIGTDVQYAFKYSGVESILATKTGLASSGKFAVGINIDNLAQEYGVNLSAFFGNRSSLKVYVGGTKEFTQTFRGPIYGIGFSNQTDYQKIASNFGSDGIISNSANLSEHIPSYLLFMNKNIDKFELDIAASGSWQDYIPLKYFGKYVKNSNNEDYYTVDMMQFNINYPEPQLLATGLFDTSSSLIKTYVAFQSIENTAVKPESQFVGGTVQASGTRVVNPESDWSIKKYEVVNGTVIYPPENIDINKIAITLFVDFAVRGVIANQVKVKSLQLASLSYNDIAENYINTKFGVPLYPYTKLGIYFNYKRKNPFISYKGSSPYLYMTKHTGFRLVGEQRLALSRGLLFPINSGKSSTYAVGAIQAAIRYDYDLFPEDLVEVFEIESDSVGNQKYIKFYLVATDSTRKRGKIYAMDTATGRIDESILFFLNGRLVRNAVINLGEWSMLGIQFGNKIEFGGDFPQPGAFRITGPLTMNNISHYQFDSDLEEQTIKTRPWINVKFGQSGDAFWGDYDTEYTWGEVLFLLSTQTANIDPASIYQVYTGTNKFIIDSGEVFNLNSYSYKFYKDLTWQNQSIIPV